MRQWRPVGHVLLTKRAGAPPALPSLPPRVPLLRGPARSSALDSTHHSVAACVAVVVGPDGLAHS